MSARIGRARRGSSINAALPAGLVLLVAVCASYATSARAQQLKWQTCPAACGGKPSLQAFLCANLTVPLDHSKPGGRNISLGLVMHPARVRSKRVGAMLFNPGGPSDQGSVYLPAMYQGYDARVLDQIDLVSWDPRGMGGFSYPYVMCFDSLDQEMEFLGNYSTFPPLGAAEQLAWADRHAAMARRCKGKDDELLAHVSTADNARDMELIRLALGETSVFYYGTSYGTFLGATYANMFPQSLRALVLDGTVDATRWMGALGDPPLSTFLRLGSDKANAATLRSFLTLCGSARAPRKACAFSAGSPQATRQRWDTLLKMAAEKPVAFAGDLFDDSTVLALTLTTLYTVTPLTAYPGHFVGWSALAELLAGLWAAATNTTAPVGSTSTNSTTNSTTTSTSPAACPVTKNYYGLERQLAVLCSETPNPSTSAEYVMNANVSLARAGYGGAIWPWISFCPGWPVKAASGYYGPFNAAKLRLPPLVIGLTGDPATPWDNAEHMARVLPNARFVSVTGYGHTTLLNPSKCAQRLVARLLIDGKAPSKHKTTCPQDYVPFTV